MKLMSSAPFEPGEASGSMWTWKAPPTRGSISASGAKNDSMPALLVQVCQTDSIGVVLPDLFGEFFSELLRGADSAARDRGPCTARTP